MVTWTRLPWLAGVPAMPCFLKATGQRHWSMPLVDATGVTGVNTAGCPRTQHSHCCTHWTVTVALIGQSTVALTVALTVASPLVKSHQRLAHKWSLINICFDCHHRPPPKSTLQLVNATGQCLSGSQRLQTPLSHSPLGASQRPQRLPLLRHCNKRPFARWAGGVKLLCFPLFVCFSDSH